MAKSKTLAESRESPAPATVVQRRTELPEKQARPRRAVERRSRSPLPPPSGGPPAGPAADILTFPGRGPGEKPRAQMSRSMQGTVGNARLSRMIGGAEQADPTILALGNRHEMESGQEADTASQITDPFIIPHSEARDPVSGISRQPWLANDITDIQPQVDEEMPSLSTGSDEAVTVPMEGAEGSIPHFVATAGGTPEMVMEREIAEAAVGSDAVAIKREGEPVILEPQRGAISESVQVSHKPFTVELPPVEAISPSAKIVPARITETGEQAALSVLPAEARAAIDTSVGVPPQSVELDDTASADGAIDVAPGTPRRAPSGEAGETVIEAGSQEQEASPSGPIVGAGAGASFVPPPDPETLRAAIPEREPTVEEFEQEFDGAHTPAQSRAEARNLVVVLRMEVESRKAEILTLAETQKAEIAEVAETQIAIIESTIATQIAAIKGTFAATRSSLQAHVDEQKAAVQAQVAADIAQVQVDTAARIAEVDSRLTERQSDLTSFADAQQDQPMVIAGEEEARAHRELEAAAREAENRARAVARRYPGREDPAPDQRAAALEVGRESATDIREKKAPIGEALRDKAAEFSGRYMDYANGVNAQIEQARPSVISALNDGADSAVATLTASQMTALQALDQRLQVELAALYAGESSAINRIQTTGATAIGQVRIGAVQAAGEIDAQAAAIVAEMDNTVQEAEAVVLAEEEPFLPGVADVVEAARGAIHVAHNAGMAQLTASANNAQGLFEDVATSYSAQATNLTAIAQENANTLLSRAMTAVDTTVQNRNQQAQTTISALAEQQQGFIRETLAEIDRGIDNARNEMRGVNDQLHGELRDVANQSISEAIKPLTDDTRSRAEAAAESAGGAWWEGLLAAIGEIIVGFLILVAVALVVAVIFGLSLGAALLIVGAVFLVIAAISAYNTRAQQLQEQGIEAGTGFLVLLALSDATGITFIGESISGEDVITGQELSDAERTRRGVVGWVTSIGIVFGVRAALKGPPGGWARPTSIFRGWRNLSLSALIENAKGVWGEVKGIGAALYRAARRGIEGVREWVNRLRGREEVTPEEVPPEEVSPEEVPQEEAPQEEEPRQPEAVSGKVALENDINTTQQRLTNVQERINKLVEGDRPVLQKRAHAVEQELARLERDASSAESTRRVERLRGELERAQHELAEIEAHPLIELGLRSQAIKAIETLENLKEDPLGSVNRKTGHNHYSAARREAGGEVVARRPDGRPYDHIRDLQEGFNALDRVRKTLEAEQRAPPESMTERGLNILLERYKETQALISRLQGFLNSIGYGPPFPPFHTWPPGA